MLRTILAYIAALLFLIALALARRVVLRWTIAYRLDPDAVRVTIFNRFAIVTMPYRDIVEISTVASDEVLTPRSGVMFAAIRAGNRRSREAVLIVRRRGLRRGVVITPERPAEFLAVVSARIAQLNADPGTATVR